MTIEKVTLSDATKLLDIYAPYVKETAISFETEVPSLSEFSKRIEDISSKFPYIKATIDGEIVGYAYATSFKGRAAYDWSVETTVYVRNDKKRSGIGKALYEALEKSLAQMGILNVNACIAVLKDLDDKNADPHLTNDSYHFHIKEGYKLVGTFHDSGYKFGRWYDMIWMEKMLGEHNESPAPVKFGNWTI